MSTYKTARIYKIVHSQSDIVYIGSTFNTLRQRWSSHKAPSNTKCAIWDYIQQYGSEQFKIVLIKEYQVCDRKHMLAYEALWISKLRCINTNTPFRVVKMYHKEYYARDEVKQRVKQYMKDNYEHRRELRQKYKEQERNYRKQRRLNAPRFNCEICGGSCNIYDKQIHLRSKKHLSAL